MKELYLRLWIKRKIQEHNIKSKVLIQALYLIYWWRDALRIPWQQDETDFRLSDGRIILRKIQYSSDHAPKFTAFCYDVPNGAFWKVRLDYFIEDDSIVLYYRGAE
jgi:hypothetical protein